MHIIKVDAIESTNSFLRDLIRDNALTEPTCVFTNEQLAGRGQMGTTWQSEKGENLTTSVFMPCEDLNIKEQFNVSMVVALAIYDTLREISLPKLTIKWPNDILSDKLKVCGILIENSIRNDRLQGVIIGIGLNINQLSFKNLPQAGSIRAILGIRYEVEEILDILLKKIVYRFKMLKTTKFHLIKEAYEAKLFRKDKPSMFTAPSKGSFVGIIQGVDSSGKLQLLVEDNEIETYDLKELKFVY
ncbi:biotin--[acetyl-CoA-carboxylase] ligase [Aquimarina intermedia]|uniref:BirA family biotin operon repressor/biotin-[acetyl-CoA-carboxylase] ligase n=1 Tax=Aquimarina intermedia TaxID=350814 RepID=A0A5S5C2F0_9FLAO|nr:biotin--[acetyl-CoA-carboxylase] ligase [Aquimarina intermedia]TYP73615.1 BirA family biotin operon repressor/biotin-[acetyl-CoA-carboxylase] ligase [Aquimarina intermedia]